MKKALTKKTLLTLITITISLSMFHGCATTQEETPPKAQASVDRFRTINANRSNEVNIVCTNCRAQFKISMKSMKSGTAIRCPKCHHYYRKGKS